MYEKLSGKLKFFILVLKVPLKSIYRLLHFAINFLKCKASIYNSKKFNDPKFLKKIIGNNIFSYFSSI